MRILFPIGAFYPSQIGGPGNTVYWHTCALTQNEIQVEVTTTMIGIDESEIVPDTLSHSCCGKVYYGRKGVYNLKTIARSFKSNRTCDILHLNSLFDLLSILNFFFTKIFHPKKPIVWSVRGELNSEALAFSALKKKVVLSLYKFFDGTVNFHSTSEQESVYIHYFFPKSNIIQIPNFILPAKRLENVPYKKQLLYIGRIHPIKAIDKLLKALSLSSSFIDSEFKLVIAGKNESRHATYLEELVKLADELGLSKKVVFYGQVKGTEKEILYAESHITILPSETENFGNVVLESLNQGTPVIASLGTPWSILEEYKCGYHCSNDPYTLAATIDKALGLSENALHDAKLRSYRLVDENFNIEYGIFKWIEEYKKLKK